MKTRLRVLRAEREWSQSELADRVGVSRQTINAYEKGRFSPSLSIAFKIARAFRKTIAEVFLDETRNAVRAAGDNRSTTV